MLLKKLGHLHLNSYQKPMFQDNASFSKQSQLARKKNDQIKYHVKNRFMALEFGRDAGKDNLVFIKMTIYIYCIYH